MRPGQNKRMRGRNNRKGPNPLTRTYESNGPDVKIRGTAHHVAEKYLQLARDAQSSGDPVMAESYLQHAEHYFRLIASAQLAQAQAQTGYVRAPGEPDMDDMDDDDDMGGLPDRFASPPERFPQPQQAFGGQQQPYGQPAFGGQQPQQPPMAPPNQPQPFLDRPPFGGDRPQGQPYQGERQPRQDRPFQDRQDRPDRQDRNQNGRNRFNDRNRENRQPREFRNDQPQPQMQPQPQPQRESFREPRNEAPEVDVAAALPSFITSPVRVSVAEPDAPQPVVNDTDQRPEGEVGGYHLRPRRRRKRPDDAAPEAGAQGDLPVGE